MFNYHLVKTVESGLTQKLYRRWVEGDKAYSAIGSSSSDSGDSAGQAQALGYDNLLFPAVLMLGGAAVGVATLALEMLCHRGARGRKVFVHKEDMIYHKKRLLF